jgi:tetratricopeptide (TPR) repeat protein
MSVQDLTPNLDETAAEPEDVTVRRLVRAVDYAEDFWLGFAKSNTLAQRRRLAALCKDLLEALKIRVVEIELSEPVTDLLPVLRERLAQEHNARDGDTPTGGASSKEGCGKLAIFVHGLEHSIPSREAYPPLLSSLNLNRELFRQQVPHPLLLWLPDYALTALARKSPDFWAWRSGLYEFAPEREVAEQSLEVIGKQSPYMIESLSGQAKRERLVMLKGLLDDYRELGDGSHEQEAMAHILNQIGMVHGMLGELIEAEQAFVNSAKIFRKLNNDAGESIVAHNLGRIMQVQGNLEEARRLYDESLEIKKRLGKQSGVAITLHQLAMLAHRAGDLEEARRLYDESLEIAKRLGKQSGVAMTLHQLAMLAEDQGEIEEARRLYDESIKIEKRLGNQSGVAITLHNLGILAEDEGDKMEAARLFRESLNILERLGSPNAEIAKRSLRRVEISDDVPD